MRRKHSFFFLGSIIGLCAYGAEINRQTRDPSESTKTAADGTEQLPNGLDVISILPEELIIKIIACSDNKESFGSTCIFLCLLAKITNPAIFQHSPLALNDKFRKKWLVHICETGNYHFDTTRAPILADFAFLVPLTLKMNYADNRTFYQARFLDAVKNNHVEVAEVFLQPDLIANLDFTSDLLALVRSNVGNETDSLPLFVAAERGLLEMVTLLLKFNPSPNQKFKTFTPLYVASKRGDVEIMKLLIAAGAVIDEPNPDGATALYIAAQEGKTEAVSLLLQHRASVDSRHMGFQPLYIASRNGHLEVVRLLIKAGALLDDNQGDGSTALYVAAQNGHTAVVKELHDAGASPRISFSGNPPLYVAAHQGHFAVVQLLLDKGADINHQTQRKMTALYVAAERGHGQIVQLLLARNADRSLVRENGFSPLHIAVREGHLDTVEILLKAGFDPNAKAHDGQTPDSIAWRKYSKRIFALLLRGPNG